MCQWREAVLPDKCVLRPRIHAHGPKYGRDFGLILEGLTGLHVSLEWGMRNEVKGLIEIFITK